MPQPVNDNQTARQRPQDNARRYRAAAGKQEVIAVRRIGLIVALGALLGTLAGAAAASPALAGGRGDGWQFISLPPSFTLPAGFCGFEIQVTQLVDKLYAKALKTADGSEAFLETGATRMSFTNPANGKTITQNGAGSFTATFFPDGSVTTVENGIGANTLESADAARFGLPGVFLATGKLTVTSAPDGTITSLSLNGPRPVDVCAALS